MLSRLQCKKMRNISHRWTLVWIICPASFHHPPDVGLDSWAFLTLWPTTFQNGNDHLGIVSKMGEWHSTGKDLYYLINESTADEARDKRL